MVTLIKFMKILKVAYSRIKTKFQSAIPTLETGNFLGVNDYDHAFRLTEVHHQVGTNPEVLMAAMEYNELGQLIKKKLHESASGNFLQEIDYEYNIRGWLTSINNPDNLQQTGEPKDMFAMQLHYNDILPTLNDEADRQFNGNISAMKWQTAYNTGIRGYGFKYDAINRLSKANYGEKSGTWADLSKYDVPGISYDANGNILTLIREGQNSTIDDLTFYYNGNQLIAKNDVISGQLEDDFTDNGSVVVPDVNDINTHEYLYDANGSMFIDDNKGIVNIEYNYLNLPAIVDLGSGNRLEFTYNAAGVKLRKQVYESGSLISDRHYVGNFEYNEGELELIHTDEGRITIPDSEYRYEYYLQDHLGNNRVMFTDDGTGTAEILQEAHYYPFGMTLAGLNYSTGLPTKYLYNGKERQDEFGLMWDDYGARFKMDERWGVIDNKAEKYYSISPYVYAVNNPIRFIDPDGNDIVDANKNVIYSNKTGWSKNASVGAMKIGNAMMSTPTGTKQFNNLVNADYGIQLVLSPDVDPTALGRTKLPIKNRETGTAEFNPDGNGIITIFEGTIAQDQNSGGEYSTYTMDEAIGAVASHEAIHATDPDNIKLSEQIASFMGFYMGEELSDQREVEANKTEEQVKTEAKEHRLERLDSKTTTINTTINLELR